MTYEEYVEASNSLPWKGLEVDGKKVQVLTREEFENVRISVKTQETQ